MATAMLPLKGTTKLSALRVYVLVFAGFFLSQAGFWVGLDSRLGKRLGRWAWIASGRSVEDVPAEEAKR